jgi:hypothetical protein
MTGQNQLSEMSNEALVRASLDTKTYDDRFLQRVQTELAYRGLTIQSFADHVFVRERASESSCTIPESLDIFDELSLWSPVEWTNALGACRGTV